jgi:hypothetical protein
VARAPGYHLGLLVHHHAQDAVTRSPRTRAAQSFLIVRYGSGAKQARSFWRPTARTRCTAKAVTIGDSPVLQPWSTVISGLRAPCRGRARIEDLPILANGPRPKNAMCHCSSGLSTSVMWEGEEHDGRKA